MGTSGKYQRELRYPGTMTDDRKGLAVSEVRTVVRVIMIAADEIERV